MELISFVILHYGDVQVTDRCVQSILCMDHQEQIRIVVVDNEINSPDKKRQMLLEMYSAYTNLHVIQIHENGGFSYANNIGYAYARNMLHSDFILVLNNDVEFVQKNFVEILLEAYRKNPCHVLGPDIVRASTGEHQNPMDTRIRTKEEAEYTIRMNEFALKWYSVLYPALFLWDKYQEKKKVINNRKKIEYYNNVQKDIVPFGACLIFTSEFVRREEKAFEPETKFYYEEYILSLKCMNKKYRTTYLPELKIIHESGRATKSSLRNERARMRYVLNNTIQSCRIYLDYLDRK